MRFAPRCLRNRRLSCTTCGGIVSPTRRGSPRPRSDRPLSIYEVHAASFRRVPEDAHRSLTWRELALALAEHVSHLGFTHVELLPIAEHPFGGSWGYQVSSYFAPT